VEGNMIFTIIQILEKQNQFPDIEKLMSDWLKRLSKHSANQTRLQGSKGAMEK